MKGWCVVLKVENALFELFLSTQVNVMVIKEKMVKEIDICKK